MVHRRVVERSERRRERELADGRRAGAWARRRAVELQRRFLKRAWKAFAVLAAFGIGGAPVFLLLPNEKLRWLAIGAWLATWVWVGAYLVLVASGAAGVTLGEWAEQWTADEVGPLRAEGWRVIHGLALRQWDMDHVLVGPGGAVVVETKARGGGWADGTTRHRLEAAARQAQGNADDLRRFLRPDIGQAPVRGVVALWPGRDAPRLVAQGVDVLAGRDLALWIRSLPPAGLPPDRVEAAWRRMSAHQASRDRADLKRTGPPARSLEQYMRQACLGVLGLLVGTVAAAALASARWPWSLVLVVAAAAAAAAARRVEPLRPAATGAFVATGTFVVFVLAFGTLALVFS